MHKLLIVLSVILVVTASAFLFYMITDKDEIHTLSIQIFTPDPDNPLMCYINSVTFSFKLRFYTVYEKGSGILTSSTIENSKTGPKTSLYAVKDKFIHNFDPASARELVEQIKKTNFTGEPGPVDCINVEEPIWWYYIKTEKNGKIIRSNYYIPVADELPESMRELNKYVYDNFMNESIKAMIPEFTQKLKG